MNFNDHSKLVGQHAFLSASKYHWINYDEEKLVESYANFRAAQRGTELHRIACDLIRNKIRLPKTNKTLNMYVNDAIGFRMVPEQVLYYSENCFGTADTICYDTRNHILRIHDYKSGVAPAHIEQLMVYNAIFCLEYSIDPDQIKTELRIYQNDEIEPLEPDTNDIFTIMDTIVTFDKCLNKLRSEE